GPNTKLVVLGDKDQLASVEAGSILGDICRGENSFSKSVASSIEQITGSPVPVAKLKSDIVDSVIFLTKSYRFGEESGIQKFAEAVNNSDDDTAIALLNDPKFTDLTWLQPTDENINSVIQEYAVQHYNRYMNEPANKRLSASNHKKMLCAVRRGRFGVDTLNQFAERVIRDERQFIKSDEWYPGRIVMSTRNDAMLKVRNGEIGLCDGLEESKILFEGENSFPVSVARLKDYEPAYAITIHKSQGSEFDEVAIILPNKVKSILSKEILYTSVTRARRNTLIIANEKIMRTAIKSSISRNSGLQQKIWGEKS
ncbi:MAG: ATP-binding domain-containing protein, partial [Gracilimonas sp.]